ncbi:unnamed protein product [marine sediment metagenome]|uniref:Uncharacterized protein n=1 Tax=marine sediment metagenome TaxID=412755 RepID=X0ZYL2_9ZZZZ
MNKNQKIILAIFIPIIIFFIALMIANLVGVTVITHLTGVTYDPMVSGQKFKFSGEVGSYDAHRNDPFDWEKTWYIWLFFIIFVCVFEYKLFADKKVINNKKKKNNLNWHIYSYKKLQK